MIAYNDPLWQSLQAYELDAANAELSFSQRLARENGWHHAYAKQVVVEYKKFLWLAMKAGHPVTPSDEVDQAWHLHLVYTQSYWEDLCRDILGRPLHHGPTRGGQQEDDKYHDWYARTLASYEAAFGAPPPAGIWPEPSARFDHHQAFRRVDVGRHWVISKNQWMPRLRWAAVLAAGAALVAWGVNQMQSPALAEVSQVKLGDLGIIAVIVAVVGFMIWRAVANSRRGGGGGSSGCSSGGGCGGGGSGCSSGSSRGCGNDNGNSSGCSSGSSGCSSSGCGGGGCGGGGD